MPRSNITSRTRRLATANTLRDNPTALTVNAPLRTMEGSDAGRAAQSLATFAKAGLTLGGQIAADRSKKQFLAGTQAASEGRAPSPEELKKDSFLIGFERVGDQRALLDMERQAQEWYASEFDKQSGTHDDLQAGLDNIYKSQFDGLDPESDVERARMEHVVDEWERINSAVRGQFDEDVLTQQAEKLQADFFEIAGADFEDDGIIDYEALNESMMPVIGGPASNDLIVSIITDLAIKNGRPDILDAMPDTWANGTPSPKHINKYDDTMRNSRQAAEAQRVYLERVAETEEDDALKDIYELSERAHMESILGEQDITSQLLDDVTNNRISSEKARTLINFQRSYQDAQIAGTPMTAESWDSYADLEVKLLTGALVGQEAQDAITAAVDAGTLGSGKTLAQNVNSLFTQLRTVESSTRNSLEFTSALDTIQADYTIERDAFNREIRASKQYQARVIRRYADLIREGVSPTEAEQRVRNEMPPREFRDTTIDTGAAAIAAAANTANVGAFVTAVGSGDPIATIEQLVNAGTLTRAQARQLAANLAATQQQGAR